MNLVFLGRPGAGKGTQAANVVDAHGLTHISTGNLLRAAMRSGTTLGQEAREYVESGQLVPDGLVVRLVGEALRELGAEEGFILDGFPRNIAQGEALEEELERQGRSLGATLFFSVTTETVVERLSGRRMCSECDRNFHVRFMPPKEEGTCDDCGGTLVQRKDDRPDAIRERLLAYDEETAPLIEFYRERAKLVEIPSDGNEGEIAAQVSKALDALAGGGV